MPELNEMKPPNVRQNLVPISKCLDRRERRHAFRTESCVLLKIVDLVMEERSWRWPDWIL